MGNFARVLHHLDMKDVKRERLEKIAAQKLKEKKDREDKKIIQEISKKYKSDWKREIYEGMTTVNALTMTVTPAEGDGTVTSIDPLDSANYNNLDVNGNPVKMYTHIGQEGGVGDDGVYDSAFVGTVIRDSGSGTGSDGGFNVGGKYLAFQGTGTPNNNARFAQLGAIDSTRVDTLTITAIVGNDNNGGEDPDLISECLFVKYKTPAMDRSQLLHITPDIELGEGNGVIIATPLDGQDGRSINNGGLNNYSITIPEYARAKNTNFILYQNFNSGSEFDNFGITNINFKRIAPVNVVVPLDDPEAISFVRVGSDEGDPKKRKKKLNDQLAASDEYTSSVLGNQFPGEGARVDGEDPFKSAPLTSDDVINASPIGKDEVKKSFNDFQQGQKTVEVLKTPEQIKAQNDEYYADLNNVLERGNYNYDDPQIVEIADKIIKLDPTSVDAYFYKSAYYSMTGESEKGLEVIDQLIKNNPDNPDGYAVRSYYREESGDLAGAIEDIEKTIELDPDSPYVSYYEMDLADLKYQEAEVEKDNAIRDRMESEAGAIEAKAHEDYWNNADLIEQEQPIEYQGDNTTAIDDLGLVFRLRGKLANLDGTSVGDRSKSYDENLAAYNQVLPQIRRKAVDYITNLDTNQFKPESDDYYVMTYKQQTMDSAEEFAEYYATEFEDSEGDPRVYKFHYDAGLRVYKSGFGIGSANPYRSQGGAYAISNIQSMTKDQIIYQFETLLRRHSGKYGLVNDTSGNSFNKNIRETTKRAMGDYLKELAKNLPDDYFDSTEIANPTTLYDQMKALYDEEDPEKEIKTELRAQGYEKQYKDLMTAWDSADKFSKFITPLKNLGDAMLGSKTAQNAKYENYKIAIAKSIMLNKPIRVNPDTIDPMLIKKLGDRITPNQILDYDEEQRYKTAQEKYIKASKASGKYDPTLVYDFEVSKMMDGEPVIPIVSEPVPYADENIYEDEFGRVFTNDGSVANNTFQADKGYHGFAQSYVTNIMGYNPIAARGQAQYQIVVPPDGTEPYLLYKDHAYHNVKSADKGEVPGFMNQGAAGFVNWLGNTAHARSDGDANTGGMVGYPPNIRGDVITEFRINLTDLPEDVQGAVYRHPLMTEQPDLVQALKDTLYTEKNVKTIAGTKDLHNFYTGALKAADAAKDWVIDNAVETIMGQMPGAFDFTTASNLLQKYDDYIQQTVHSPDGKTYVPGFIDANGNISQRIDLTDQLTSRDTKHLEKMMFGTGTSPEATLQDKYLKAILKGYNNKTISEKSQVRNQLTTQLKQQINKLSGEGTAAPTKEEYSPSLSNSLGKGLQVDVDEFLKGKLVIKKSYEFRHDDKIDSPIANGLAMMFDVSNDTIAAGGRADKSLLLSLVTMNAARQLLRPVRGPGIIPGTKQSFAQAMNTAPSMPYKVEIPLPQYLIDIMNDIEQEDKDKSDPRSGIAGLDEPLVIDKDKKNNKKNNVKESTLFERLKQKQFFNPNDIKPVFPENPPPQLDPKTGMHPRYGKNANRYKKLDPISANAMPPTGDPETDAVVDKQRTKPKTFAKFKKKLKENFTVVSSGRPTNSATQTFQHVSGQNFSFSGLGGQETHPSTVTVFGETIPAPNYNQLAIAGYAKPLVMQKKKLEDTNPKLDASQEFAQKVGADVMMNARVKTELSLEQKREAVKKYKNDLEEYDKKSEARARENESRRKSNLSKVRSFVAKYGENLDDIKGVQTFIKIAEGGKKLIVINQDSIFRDLSDKFNVRVYEAEQGKVITRQTGNFGRVDSSIFDNPFTNRKSSGQATVMYDGVGGEVENKTFSIEEVPPIQTPEPPEHMKKNLSKGWQPVTKEDEGMINKLNTFFGTSVTGVKFAAKLAIQLARGDTTPITKSPGVGFDANATRVIHSAIKVALDQNKTSYSNDNDSWYDPKTGMGQVMNNAYTILENPIDNITRAALGKFTFKVTPKGVQVIDTYDISKVTHIGSVSNPITDFITKIITAGHGRGTGFTDQFGQSYDAQQTANVITGIAMRRGAELGFDMVDTDGKTIQPIFSMEDAYADSQQLATPKGFNIPINYTMPTGITIKNLLNPRQYTQNRKSSKAVNRIKSMAKTRRQSLSLDEPIVRRKKKRG